MEKLVCKSAPPLRCTPMPLGSNPSQPTPQHTHPHLVVEVGKHDVRDACLAHCLGPAQLAESCLGCARDKQDTDTLSPKHEPSTPVKKAPLACVLMSHDMYESPLL